MMRENILRLAGLVVIIGLSIFLFKTGYQVIGGALHLMTVVYLLWGTLNPQSRWFGPIQTQTENDQVWLTFDDGPDLRDTPKLLELLKAYRVKATFFVVGEKAEKHPALIRQIHEQGHQIGNHTWSHPQSTFWCAGPWRTYREIVKCQHAVEQIIGVAPRVFRAPVGHSNFFVHAVLRKLNVQLVGWSSRGFDGVSQDTDQVLKRIKASLKPGGILLVHENSEIAVDVAQAVLD
ncbi:MAG: polysaccharide deacetylase family protein, partial [Verrucomicrobiae bacterium]|nr:polysaccharide deacetylase family protein [Verrucomicrobiae bacterium]NNJ86847.1 polysaccharide deacetylase family protein [Akkermansiaceae bacterium]